MLGSWSSTSCGLECGSVNESVNGSALSVRDPISEICQISDTIPKWKRIGSQVTTNLIITHHNQNIFIEKYSQKDSCAQAIILFIVWKNSWMLLKQPSEVMDQFVCSYNHGYYITVLPVCLMQWCQILSGMGKST